MTRAQAWHFSQSTHRQLASHFARHYLPRRCSYAEFTENNACLIPRRSINGEEMDGRVQRIYCLKKRSSIWLNVRRISLKLRILSETECIQDLPSSQLNMKNILLALIQLRLIGRVQLIDVDHHRFMWTNPSSTLGEDLLYLWCNEDKTDRCGQHAESYGQALNVVRVRNDRMRYYVDQNDDGGW